MEAIKLVSEQLLPAWTDAVAEVLEHGKKTQREMAIVLRQDGSRLLSATGNDECVTFTTEQLHRMEDAGNCTLVHNHPVVPGTLSVHDIMMANRLNGQIWAVGEDGARWGSHGLTFKLKAPESVAAIYTFIAGLAKLGECARLDQEVKKRAIAAIAPVVKRDRLSPDQADTEMTLLWGHWRNLLLRDKGLLDYHYVVGEQTRKIFEKYGANLDAY